MNRYKAIDRSEAIQLAFDVLLAVVDHVLPVDLAAVEGARDDLLAQWGLSARDALHVAMMRRHGVDRILSFDKGSTPSRESID